MNNPNQTLKEIFGWALAQQSLYIKCNDNGDSFELKFDMIHLFHTFHGLVGEDPKKHLKEFHVIFSSMKPNGTTEE